MELNKYQVEAVNHFNGPCLVTSVPGSGKTRVLVERVIRLIDRGIDPENILCLTFTNKAANEMKLRVCDRLQLQGIDSYIGTFHALCVNLLRQYGEEIGFSSNFNILDDKDQKDLILQTGRMKGYEIDRVKAAVIASAVNYDRDQMEDFDYISDTLDSFELTDVAETYLEVIRQRNLIDFSGLIYNTIKMIEDNEKIKEEIQEKFKYILVDETQDTNVSQYYLVNLLGEKLNNIMLIGDTDQSIYKFRGARYQNIQSFLDQHSDCKMVSLSKNYRSTPQIVKVADKLIKNNKSHIDIVFETDNRNGEKVKCVCHEDQVREASWIARRIERLIYEGGWEPSDMAILYRMNKMSEPVEQALSIKGIKYEVIGSRNFYDRKEVKDCLCMLKFLVNKYDGIAFHRLCGLLKGVGDVTIGKIENRSHTENIDIVEACREMANERISVSVKQSCQKICDIYDKNFDLSNPARCIDSLVNDFNYTDHLEKKFDKNLLNRKENMQQLIDSAGLFAGQENGAEKYLQQISLMSASDKDIEDNKVTLMSLHASKGLEFPIVFIIGVEHNILPHSMALEEDRYANLEEERRLFYVGITRAEKLLHVTWCKNRLKYGRNGMTKYPTYHSRFLKECGLIEK